MAELSALTADHLRREKLLYSTAEELPDIVRSIPVGVEVVEIVAAYEIRKARVYCSICEAHSHHKGFVIALSDGTAATGGSTCGPREFNTTFAVAVRDFKFKRALKEFLTDADLLVQQTESIIAELKELRATASQLARFVQALLVNHGALVGQLQAAAGRDGKLPGVLELVEKDTGGKGVQRERVERGAVQLRGLRFLNITKAGTDPVSQAVKALRDFQSAMADPLVQVQSGELRAKRAEIQRHLRVRLRIASVAESA